MNTVRENMAKMDIKSGEIGWPPKTFKVLMTIISGFENRHTNYQQEMISVYRHVLERADFGWTFTRLSFKFDLAWFHSNFN